MFTYPNFGVKKIWLSLKSENYHLPASVCVEKDLKNDQLGEYFVVITTSGWFLLEYTSQNYIHVVELLKVTASKLCKRSRTLLNIDLSSKSHLESELLSLKWISRQQLPCDYHLCASVTYVCCVSNKQIWQNYHLSKLSLKCENYQLPASVCVKKDLKNRSVRRIFCGNNDIWVMFVGVYFSKQ